MASVLKSADSGIALDDKIPLLNLDKSPLSKVKSLQNAAKREEKNGSASKPIGNVPPTAASKPKPDYNSIMDVRPPVKPVAPTKPIIEVKPAPKPTTTPKPKPDVKPTTKPALSKPKPDGNKPTVDTKPPVKPATETKPPIKVSHTTDSIYENKQPKPPVVNRSVSNLTEASTAFKKLSVQSGINVSSKSLDKLSGQFPTTVFDITTLTEEVTEVPQILLKNRKVLEEESKVLSLDWSSDSKQIVTSLQSGHLCIWEVLNKDRIYAVQTPCTWVFTAAFSPSQGYIAAGGLDSKCDVYKIPRGKQSVVETQHVAQHQSYVLACMFTSSDHQILTASSDKTSGLWDVESSHLIRDFKGHSADVTSLDFQKSSGHCFATGSADHQVALWDMRSGLCVQSFASHTDEVNQVKFFPSGDAVASVSDDMTCQLFDLRMNARLATFKRNSILFPAGSLDFSLNGRLLFVGYGDHSFHVWDTLKGSHCGCMYSHENKVNVLKLSPDGSYLATGSWDQSVKLWSC